MLGFLRLCIISFFTAGSAVTVYDLLQQQRARLELELPLSYNPRDVKAAFRRKSLDAHPDKGGSEVSFLRVTHAYERLSGQQPSSSGGRLAVSLLICWICCSAPSAESTQERLRRERKAQKRREQKCRRRERALLDCSDDTSDVSSESSNDVS